MSEHKMSPLMDGFCAGFGAASLVFTTWTMAALLAFQANLALYFPSLAAIFPFTVDGGRTYSSDWLLEKLTGRHALHTAEHKQPAAAAVARNVALMALFCATHSIMARQSVKDAQAKLLPERLERSLYCAVAAVQLCTLMALWSPLPMPLVWEAPEHVHWLFFTVQALAIGYSLTASPFSGGPLEMFGFDRAFSNKENTQPRKLQTQGHYAYMRHPMMIGFTVALLVHPTMSAGHLLQAVCFMGYNIGATLTLEERDLEATFGSEYAEYKQKTPAFVPRGLCPVLHHGDSKDQ